MSILSPEDYEKVIEFYTRLNRDYSKFEENSLELMAELFGYRLTAYCEYKSYNGRTEAEHIISHTLRRDLLKQYKEKAVYDNPLILNYARLCYNNADLNYLTDAHLVGYAPPPDSAYLRLLEEYHIGRYAVLGVNNTTRNLVHLIHVFMPQQYGDFTPHDLALFAEIGRVFNYSKSLYSSHMQYVGHTETLMAYCDTADFGFAILDRKGRLIQQNSLFKRYSSRISAGLTDQEVISDVLHAVIGQRDLLSSPNFLKTAQLAGLEIIVRKKRTEMSHGMEHLTFITLNRIGSRKALTIDHSELTARFGFTKREAEVAELIMIGCDNRQISETLFIALPTVKAHIGHIFQKAGVSSRTELVNTIRSQG